MCLLRLLPQLMGLVKQTLHTKWSLLVNLWSTLGINLWSTLRINFIIYIGIQEGYEWVWGAWHYIGGVWSQPCVCKQEPSHLMGACCHQYVGRLHEIVDRRWSIALHITGPCSVCVFENTRYEAVGVWIVLCMWLKYDTTKCNITRCMAHTTQCVYGIHCVFETTEYDMTKYMAPIPHSKCM